MADTSKPTQRTPEGAERDRLDLPGEGGTVIPVPSREDVLRDLEQVAKPKRSQRESGPKQ